MTGGEIPYADMRSFGRGSITTAWCSIAHPGLVLHRLGQGAMLVEHPVRTDIAQCTLRCLGIDHATFVPVELR